MSANQRGIWAVTALFATAVTIACVFYNNKDSTKQRQSKSEDDVDDNKNHQVKADSSPHKHGNNNRFTSIATRNKEIVALQEEKKEMDEIGERRRPVSEITVGGHETLSAPACDEKLRILSKGLITIAHASVTGSSAKLAKQLEESLRSALPKTTTAVIQVCKMDEFDWWDEFLNDPEEDNDMSTALLSSKSKSMKNVEVLPKLILLLPTYTSGSWPPRSTTLQTSFEELQNDWRIEKFPLKKKLHTAIFGLGSSAYGDDSMGKPAREAQMHLHKLGAKTIARLAIGDDSVGDHLQQTFFQWTDNLISQIKKFDGVPSAAKKSEKCCGSKSSSDGGTCCQSDSNSGNGNDECGAVNNNDEENDGSNMEYPSGDEEEEHGEPEVVDLEDMGDIMAATNGGGDSTPQEMVTPSQAVALKKEGYKLIGTHSAVKLCRWTKHQLRGRGGCYKHTFYGITSYQCMEATPSLACANKCVFCWRHHKNPVGKEWRWKTDDPNYIVDQAVKTHVNMIKETKGIPGVRMDRWKEAHTVRHCALSLVGEPIMYPRISELLSDLHNRKISTFLVTNGQHPQAIESLQPITQLYVSVDAPTQDSLIAIDRPLFQDAWDRLKQSLVSLKNKGQRTVARLTVVKGWNSDEVEGYAKLIALGEVSLVEVKGVTFCGKSDASNLNMTNTPWHHEVVALTTTLKEELDKLRKADGSNSSLAEYGLACEHKHSCSVLLARVDQFAHDDPVTGCRKWRTWIDYDKFHELAMRNAEDPSFTFSVKDYVADTPNWALIGSEEEGFDPTDTRHRKKTKYPKYTQFDVEGIPTHDHQGNELDGSERQRLKQQMEEKKNEIGCGTTVTEMKDGAKEIQDASLMFRGLVITK